MKANLSFDQIKFYLLILVAVSLPYNRRINALLIVLLTVVVITDIIINKRKIKFNLFFGLLISLYFLNILGLLYSENIKDGLFRLETQASFVAFPLILSQIHISKSKLKIILFSWVLTCFIAMILCQATVTWRFFTNQEHPLTLDYYMSYRYTYQQVTQFLGIHTAYMGLYIIFSNIILLTYIVKSYKLRKQILSLLIVLYQSLFIFQLTSKTAIILNSFILSIAFVYFFVQQKRLRYKFLIVLIFFASIFVIYSVMQFPISRVLDRLAEMITPGVKETRLDIWNSAIEVIQNNWLFGVGTGDVKEHLVSAYIQNGLSKAIEFKYGTHNQYLDYLVRFGITGFIIFILNLIIPLKQALKGSNLLYSLFIFISCIAFITENILSLQWGIVFFSLFICIFYKYEKDRIT